MAYSVSHVIGCDLNNPVPVSFSFTNGSPAVTIPNCGPLGMEVFGSDGRLYVLAQAAGAITAGVTNVAITNTGVSPTFQATSGAGSYTYPGSTNLVSGDVAWFYKASV